MTRPRRARPTALLLVTPPLRGPIVAALAHRGVRAVTPAGAAPAALAALVADPARYAAVGVDRAALDGTPLAAWGAAARALARARRPLVVLAPVDADLHAALSPGAVRAALARALGAALTPAPAAFAEAVALAARGGAATRAAAPSLSARGARLELAGGVDLALALAEVPAVEAGLQALAARAAPARVRRQGAAAELARAREILEAAGPAPSDHDVKRALAAAGMPVARQAVVTSPTAAGRIAARLAGPVELAPLRPPPRLAADLGPVEGAPEARAAYARLAMRCGARATDAEPFSAVVRERIEGPRTFARARRVDGLGAAALASPIAAAAPRCAVAGLDPGASGPPAWAHRLAELIEACAGLVADLTVELVDAPGRGPVVIAAAVSLRSLRRPPGAAPRRARPRPPPPAPPPAGAPAAAPAR